MSGDSVPDSVSVVVLDVEQPEGVNQREQAEIGETALGPGVPLRSHVGLLWRDASGDPDAEVPQLPQDTYAFVIGTAVAFVLLAAASGIIGGRADGAFSTLVDSLPVKRRREPQRTIPRETALRRAYFAAAATWPADVDIGRAQFWHEFGEEHCFMTIVEETPSADGGWTFRFYSKGRIGAPEPAEGDERWLYTASVPPGPAHLRATRVDLSRSRVTLGR